MIGNQPQSVLPKPANPKPTDDKLPDTTKQVAKDEGERFLKAIFRTVSDDIAAQAEKYDAQLTQHDTRLAEIEKIVIGIPGQFQKLQTDVLRIMEEKMQLLKSEQQKLLQSSMISLRTEVVSAIDTKNEQLKQDVTASFEQFESTMQANLEAVGALEVKLNSAKIVFPEGPSIADKFAKPKK